MEDTMADITDIKSLRLCLCTIPTLDYKTVPPPGTMLRA